MEFAFTEEQAMIAQTVQTFFAENATSERTRAAMEAGGIDRELWASFCEELGLSGIGIAEEDGGVGLGMVELAIVAEAAGSQVSAIPLLGLATAGQAIAAGGNIAQKEQWLGPLISGEAIAAAAYAPALKVEGGRLSGTVPFVAHGSLADLFVFVGEDAAWLVAAEDAGLSVVSHTTMDQTRPLATVTLEGANAQALDFAPAREALHAGGWICLAAEALGGAQATLDRTVQYSTERMQFGRPIGSFQAYKHRLADMMVLIEQARSAVYWAACAVDEGAPEAQLALHSAKSFCADTYFECAGHMIQLHGGIGFTWEHDAHLFFKRATSIRSMMGDGDWHREQVARLTIGEAS
ncbi:acyl-CoA dehydrogenase family protein [Novosphingobium sp. KN65.2]|uniref:acyl-CoA dehydrogenase family protein n=1 Tax=Novosphingobium sp. KN65.2 TaxID=1478134 RepID=UPI0005DE2A74|nr:acyl-CoA dehydrogenase family protein [Novosphingobium sp. KN65.2]CDO36227.1 Acyl-CoA dehydrogenase domain protein [Novosphingobium sp. KN65.2]